MNKTVSNLNDLEFNCMLAISSDAFDINSFLNEFIKGERMNDEHYKCLLDTARDLLDQVKTLKVFQNRCRFDREQSEIQNGEESFNPANY